jgi:hypothetical protein
MVGVFNQQPQLVCCINQAHPLAAGLVFACYPVGGAFYDAVSGKTAMHTGLKRFRNTIDGNKTSAISAIGSNSTGGTFVNPTGLDAISGAFSMFVEGSLEVNASTQELMTSRESGAGNGMTIKFDDVSAINNGFQYYANNGDRANSTFTALGANSEQFTHRAMITADGTNARFYAKRGLNNTSATAVLPTANTARRTTMCGFQGSEKSGSISLGLAWNRVLSLAEYQMLYDNPWQLFLVPSRPLFAPSSGGVQSLTVTPIGGIVFSGAAATLKSAIKAPTGGIQFGGAATFNRGIVRAVSGGIVFGGSATQLRGRSIMPVGGLNFSGTATILRGVIRTATGGLVFSGTAPVTFSNGAQSLVVTPVGGIIFSGAAAIVRTCSRLVSGGLHFGGAASVESTGGGGSAGGGDWYITFLRRRKGR